MDIRGPRVVSACDAGSRSAAHAAARSLQLRPPAEGYWVRLRCAIRFSGARGRFEASVTVEPEQVCTSAMSRSLPERKPPAWARFYGTGPVQEQAFGRKGPLRWRDGYRSLGAHNP